MKVSNTTNNQYSPALSAEIEGIASDNKSGAAEILRRAGAAFSLLSASCHDEASVSIEDAKRMIIETCLALARSQPDMSPLLRLSSAAISAALEADGGRQALNAATDAALEFVEKSASNARAASLHASRLVLTGQCVLTHSLSSTVAVGLIEARRAGRDFSVVATESRPMLEGRVLAKTLAGEDIRVTLIADAAASLVLNQVDFVFVGADKITPKHVVNKIGTRMLALAAREHGVPVYALCDGSKFISKDYFASGSENEKSADELWPDAPPDISISNRYFEQIPLVYFTGIITEEGVLSNLDAAQRASEVSLAEALVQAVRNHGQDEDSGN